jgi:hypothetical protein
MLQFIIFSVVYVVLSLVIAFEIGAKKEIGWQWSLFICLSTFLLLGFLMTVFSRKLNENEQRVVYYRRERTESGRVIGNSCIVLAVVLCIVGCIGLQRHPDYWIYYAGLLSVCPGIFGIAVYNLRWNIQSDNELTFYDVVQFYLIQSFVYCFIWAGYTLIVK